jgi:hypothetical protein
MRTLVLASAAMLLLPACTAKLPPVEVTRFHVSETIAPGAIAIAPMTDFDGNSIEFRTYAIAVSRELARLGFAEGANPSYSAEVGYSREARDRLSKGSPVTIGIGGGSFGRHVGVGLGTSFGIGGDNSRKIIISRLEVRLKRATDGTVVWEGRAQTEAPSNAPAAQPGLAADKLSRALFADFPGESGKTIAVP